MEALFFTLDNQTYAIDLDEIDEVLNMATLRSMTEAPPFVSGLLNLRGQLLPVVDLSRRLGYMRPEPPPPLSSAESPLSCYGQDTRLLVLTIADSRIVMIIDGLKDIRQTRDADSTGAGGGMGSMLIMDDGSTVQLVRTKNVLSGSELEELQSFNCRD